VTNAIYRLTSSSPVSHGVNDLKWRPRSIKRIKVSVARKTARIMAATEVELMRMEAFNRMLMRMEEQTCVITIRLRRGPKKCHTSRSE